MPPEPTDEQLLAFAESLLQNVESALRDRAVLEEAIEKHRATWLKLYEAGKDLGTADQPVPG